MNLGKYSVFSFLSEFNQRKGSYIFGSDLLIKINGLLLSVIVVRLFDKDTFGAISYSRSLLFPMLAFVGMGANHALLRFGALRKSKLEKWIVYKYANSKGLIGSAIVAAVFLFIGFFASRKLPEARIFLLILSLQIFSTHLIVTFRSLTRILKLNKLYAFSGLTQSVLLLVLGYCLTYFFDGYGYVLSIVLSPLLCYFFYTRYVNNLPSVDWKNAGPIINRNEFWSYGVFVGLGSIASQSLFDLGIIMSGIMIADAQEIAMFKVASIVPYNLLFLPKTFLKTDYVFLTENAGSKDVISSYMKKYWMLFGIISICIAVPMISLSKNILEVLFGSQYVEGVEVFRVLTISIVIVIMFRKLFGSILLAVGKANWNVMNAGLTLIVNAGLNYVLITKYGMLGAAYSLVISFCFGSFVSALLLFYYIKNYTE